MPQTEQTTDLQPSIERLAFRPNELPAVLGISRGRAFQLLRSGELASVRKGRTRLISRQAINKFLEAETEAA